MDFGCLFDGKYRIIRLIGSGGCGRVYLAENVRMKTFWAIKEIPCDDTNVRQVEREIEVLEAIRHPALPRVVDVLRENGAIYLIEDYFDGRNAEELLREKTRIDMSTAVKWAREICDIMIFLHGQTPEPIIYRDLKPSNIIISSDGTLRLVDFGSVRRYKTDSPSDTIYIGTRGYAAPEQYGSGQTTKQSDIYSFGITMLQIVTGKRPPNTISDGCAGGADIAAYYKLPCGGIVSEAGFTRSGGGGSGGGDSGGCGGDGGGCGGDSDSSDAGEGYFAHIKPAPDPFMEIFTRCIEKAPENRYQSFYEIKSDLSKVAPIKRIVRMADTPVRLASGAAGTYFRKADDPPGATTRKAAEPVSTLPRPMGVYRCATISVTQNHEFAFEFAYRASDRYGLRTLILDVDFETTLSEWYFTSCAEKGRNYNNDSGSGNSLYQAVELVEKAASSEFSGNSQHISGDDMHKGQVVTPKIARYGENALTGANVFADIPGGRAIPPGLVWLNEPDPRYSGPAAVKLLRNRGLALRRLLSEVTVCADVCILLTGCSIFSELNLRCFQNSHFILCPGHAEKPAIRAFNNTALLAERLDGIPANRFKYIIWEYQQNETIPEIITELTEESLAGVVRKSRRRESARRGSSIRGCYAYSMEQTVKKDYDDIIKTLGISEIKNSRKQKRG